jgi:5' nucleotidase, deoxy (Pyrimidine), cytosolic type C protein (NT5C)
VSRQLFLDCDGVLADFEAGARDMLGMSPRAFEERYGKRAFWREVARTKDFYARLPLMPDARALFDRVAHLEPIILTGLPLGNWAAPQKVRWAEEHFPGTHIITCMARDKYRHMKGADVLVDDRADHRDKWEAAGGIFVHHEDARSSLAKLAEVYSSIRLHA